MTDFVAGPPIQEPLPPEAAPKRRGRPPKLDPATGEPINKTRRRGRPRRSRANLTPQIQAFLTLANTGVMMAQGKLPPPQDNGDALDEREIELLAKAINQQCDVSPRFRRYVEVVIGVGSGGQLLVVAMMIGGRRLARHGVLPQFMDAQIGTLLGSVEVSEQAPERTEDTNDGDDSTAAAAA